MHEPGGISPPLAEVLQGAARVWSAFCAGQSLDRALARNAAPGPPQLRAAIQDVSFAAVRRRAFTERVIGELAPRPPAQPVQSLLAVALPQLLGDRHAPYTVVDQAAAAAHSNPATRPAAGFVNAILRNFLRRQQELIDRLQCNDEVRYNAPRWWIEALRAAQPQHWQDILASVQPAPPLVLRVNQRRTTVADYLQCLAGQGMDATRAGRAAVWLHRPLPVARIPGFAAGDVSVQDAGAQLAAEWLGAGDGMRVLDVCAAPGGKTAHLTELADLSVTAVEIDAERARRIGENLERVGTTAQILVADARDPAAWWDGRPYDRILLDAPCTASGIVRRHPDIPWLRRETDVADLATVQAELLEALWPLLEVGGRLLYVVCSVFPQEGSAQIEGFAVRHPEALLEPLPGGTPTVQMLPALEFAGSWDERATWPTPHDGFFYARLEKSR